jgi:hypothetical protein
MRRQAGIKQSTFTDPKLNNAGALATVENEIKKVLQETTKSVFHGYFVTADPYTVTLNSGDWGGVVMKSSRHSQVHKQNAVVGQTRMSDLNRQVTTDRGLGANGITMTYIQKEMLTKHNFTVSTGSKMFADANSVYEEMLGRAQALAYGKKRQTTESIKKTDDAIWNRYKGGYR